MSIKINLYHLKEEYLIHVALSLQLEKVSSKMLEKGCFHGRNSARRNFSYRHKVALSDPKAILPQMSARNSHPQQNT